MRLTNYLTEDFQKALQELDVLIPTIKKECKPWLSQTHSGVVYRGMKNTGILKKTVRKNRKPLDTTKERHDLLNIAFKEHFGWKARSEGLFVTPRPARAVFYGDINLILPIGKFKYLWSEDIADLFTIAKYKDLVDPKVMKKVMDQYTDKNINKALTTTSEIMLNVNKYYAIYYEIIHAWLLKYMPEKYDVIWHSKDPTPYEDFLKAL